MKKLIYILTLGLSSFNLWAQIPNAGFESWDSLSVVNNIRIYNPVDWNSSNIERVNFNGTQTVQLTTDAHTGNFAVKLISAIDDNQEQATYLASGNFLGNGPNDPVDDKFPLNGRINGFEGYYKYVPHIEDTFRVFLALYRDGQYLGQSYMELGVPTNTYTKFWWPVVYPATITPPDSAKFIIEPSIFNDSEGSVLFLDDLNITYGFTTGLDGLSSEPSIQLYPNPAKEQITLFGYDPRYHYVFAITSMDGKQVRKDQLTNESVDISSLENGLYVLTLVDENGKTITCKFSKHE